MSTDVKRGVFDSVPLIKEFLSQCYVFRHNVVLSRTEFRTIDDFDFELLKERDLCSLFCQLHHAGIRCNISTLRYVLASDFTPAYNPFQEYFMSLPEWNNEQPDYIKQLTETVRTTDDERWERTFRKWLVATVACAMKPEIVNHQVLVFVGPQGMGKSKWQHRLVPDALKGYVYSGEVNPTHKDAFINLSEVLLIILDELENLNKTQLGSLKALITQSTIRVRTPYASVNENFIRRASFLGSVNDLEFLTDTTGNRRFLPFICTSINYNHEANMDDVLRQAYALYKGGFKFWFDKDDISELEEANDAFMRVTLEEESLLKYFSKPESGAEIQLMTTTEVAQYLEVQVGGDFKNSSSIRRLGQALVKHGFERTSTKDRKPWKVKIVSD
jgi:predicted P-loop ATPase